LKRKFSVAAYPPVSYLCSNKMWGIWVRVRITRNIQNLCLLFLWLALVSHYSPQTVKSNGVMLHILIHCSQMEEKDNKTLSCSFCNVLHFCVWF